MDTQGCAVLTVGFRADGLGLGFVFCQTDMEPYLHAPG